MAVNLNLLPTDLAASKGVAQTAGLLRKIIISIAALFVIFSALGLSATFILSSQLRVETNKEETLATNVKNLESVEQRFLLVRDRVGKSQGVIKSRETEKNIESLNTVISFLPQGVTISDAEILNTKSKLTFSANSSSSLTQFLSQLVSRKVYKDIVLKSFSFNPATGYLILLEAS